MKEIYHIAVHFEVYITLFILFELYRDDEHRTALQLAAAKGHTQALRILLDNHASVNDVDKLKVIYLTCFVRVGAE